MDKITGLLHLANKAGKLALGQTRILESIKRKKPALIIVANDAGHAIKRKLARSDFIEIGMNSEELGFIFGRVKVSLAAILDIHLAKEIRKSIESSGLLKTV